MDWAMIGGIAALIAATFKLLDYFVSDDENSTIKEHLFAWKQLLGEYTFSEIARSASGKISRVYDAIYGKKYFSLRCVLFSCISSVLAMVLSYTILVVFFPQYENFSIYDLANSFPKNLVYVLFVVTLIADYFSIIETRIILKILGRFNILKIAIISLVDLLISGLIYILVLLFFINIVQCVTDILGVNGCGFRVFYIVESYFYSVTQWSGYRWVALTGEEVNASGPPIGFGAVLPLAVFAWSTFFTSIIFQMYFLFYVFAKCLDPLSKRGFVLLQKFENSDRAVFAFGVFLAANSAVILGLLKLISL